MPGSTGRRSPWPTVLVTAGFIVAGPPGAILFVAAPLLCLLAVSRPRHREEWLGIIAMAAIVTLVLRSDATVIEQTSRAMAIAFAGSLLVTALLGLRSLADKLILAAAGASAVTIGWSAHLGIHFAGIRAAVVTMLWEGYRAYPGGLSLPPTPYDQATLDGMSAAARAGREAQLSAYVHAMSGLYPGILVVGALVGGWIAWLWYHRIAQRPMGVPSPPVSRLRFNDQLVWGLIGGLGLTLFTLPEPIGVIGSNVLFVLGALYWARGLAITRYALAMFPAPPLFKIALTALLVLPLAFGGWLVMGVADTWLDIRRRLQPPKGVSP